MFSEKNLTLNMVQLTRKKSICWFDCYFIICLFLHRVDKTVAYTQEEKIVKETETLGSKILSYFLRSVGFKIY